MDGKDFASKPLKNDVIPHSLRFKFELISFKSKKNSKNFQGCSKDVPKLRGSRKSQLACKASQAVDKISKYVIMGEKANTIS